MRVVDQTAERGQRIPDIADVELLFHLDPGGKKIFVGNEVTNVFPHELDHFGVVLAQRPDISL
ncbi:hypothetical protein SDC9_122741 [bioreactor metagenome]|uniref:Uncharacterized protein n=1 Tax=bioreactor metagenome TaxID=1076179 RepID=A0A645CFL8_9ZZZZ